MIVAGTLAFLLGLRDFGRSYSTTRWPVDDKQRSYVFFFINPATKRLDYRAVDEFVEPEPATP